jgi:hypothetical protein
LRSPTVRTECGAKFFDLYVVPDVCAPKKARNLRKIRSG